MIDYIVTAVISMSIKKSLTKLVNFCVAILILIMEENTHFLHIMLYFFQKDKNATEVQKRICAVYEEGVVTNRTCQMWFMKFVGTSHILAQ